MQLEGASGVDEHWPRWRRRTPYLRREEARYRVDFEQTFDELVVQLGQLGLEEVTIYADVDLRQADVLPEPDDPGVVISFQYLGREYRLACDKWTSVKDNLRAIGRTLKRVRRSAHDGVCPVKEGLEPFRRTEYPQHWWQIVLGVAAGDDWGAVKHAYRQLAKRTHPDTGDGNGPAFQNVQRAYEAARDYYGQ